MWNEALTLVFDSLRLEYALVINNDVILRTDAYRLLRDDGGLFVTGVGVGTPEEMAQATPTARSPHPSFSCFLMRRECWERVGEFDEGMWAWAGDGDYHLRMHAEGIDAASIAVPFGHEVSATIKLAEPEERDRLGKQADADRAYFKKKWGCAIGSDDYYKRLSPEARNVYKETGRLDGRNQGLIWRTRWQQRRHQAKATHTPTLPPTTSHNTCRAEPKIGAHVMYVDGAVIRDALVQVVFTEHGMPPLTLVLVKPGSRGDLQTRQLVPHQSKRAHGEACWCRPEEVK